MKTTQNLFRCTSCKWIGPESELDFYGPQIRCPKCARSAELDSAAEVEGCGGDAILDRMVP